MYEELVARVRYHIQKANFMGLKEAESTLLLGEAADAIEELQKAVNFHKFNSEFWEDKYNSLADEKWIPVTERLPEQKINQNTLDFEYVLCATTVGDVRPYKFGRRIGQGESHFWNGAGYVDTYVTHWMPLPEPPEEET